MDNGEDNKALMENALKYAREIAAGELEKFALSEQEEKQDSLAPKKGMFKKYGNLSKKNRIIVNGLTVLIVFLSVMLAHQLYSLGQYYYHLYISAQISAEAKNLINSLKTPSPRPTLPTPAPTPEQPDPEGNETPQPYQPPQGDLYENRELSAVIETLRSHFGNEDIVGYIEIAGTTVSYAIVQAADNTYYLKRDLYKKNNSAGSIFLDNANSPNLTDSNNVLYGHNMGDKTLFHDLRYYVYNMSYVETRSEIIVHTLYEETVWEIFSAYTVPLTSDYIVTDFANRQEYEEFIKMIQKRSFFQRDVTVTADDTILTLSTCTNVNDGRIAVHAKLVERR